MKKSGQIPLLLKNVMNNRWLQAAPLMHETAKASYKADDPPEYAASESSNINGLNTKAQAPSWNSTVSLGAGKWRYDMGRNVPNVIMGLFVAVVLGLAGCGGGGSGGGEDLSASYKGSTTQASVTAANAKAVSVDAVQIVQDVTNVGVLGKSVADVPTNPAQMQSIARIIEESIASISSKAVVAKTVAETVQGTQSGYSGSYSFSANGNESSGAISGSIAFNAYKSDAYAPTISGTITFSAVINTSTAEIVRFTTTFSNVTFVSGSGTNTLNGSISISISGTTETLSISTVRHDSVSNNTYWAKDFNFVVTGNSMTMSGTYYDHVYGYVVVSTLTPLGVSDYSSTPTSGSLLFTGSNGTKARLTYTYSGYILEVDATGNNIFVVVP